MIGKKEFIQDLKDSGRYKEVYSFWVDELFYNLDIIKKTKKAIKDNGGSIFSYGDKDGKILQQHPAQKIYKEAYSVISSISSKLGLSPLDEAKLGLEEKGEDNGFEEE